MKDLPKEFVLVGEKHGGEMLQAVLDAGLCSEAVGKLVDVSRAMQRPEVMAAVMVLARAYNRLSTEYCKGKGWTEAMLAECDRDLQLAFAGKVWTPEQGGKIILDS